MRVVDLYDNVILLYRNWLKQRVQYAVNVSRSWLLQDTFLNRTSLLNYFEEDKAIITD